MAKVYVVAHVEYDMYEIVYISLSHDKAKEFHEKYNPHNKYGPPTVVDEYELDKDDYNIL